MLIVNCQMQFALRPQGLQSNDNYSNCATCNSFSQLVDSTSMSDDEDDEDDEEDIDNYYYDNSDDEDLMETDDIAASYPVSRVQTGPPCPNRYMGLEDTILWMFLVCLETWACPLIQHMY